jgi:hypothetical protein
MTGVDTSLLIGLCVALAVSVGNKRAWGWLLAGAASYTASVLYWRSGLPYAPFIAGMCDALICLAIYFWAKTRWEMMVWRLFQASVLVNIVYLGGTLNAWPSPSHNAYSIILELINWAALLWIGGNGAYQPVGASTDALPTAGGPLRRLHRALSALHKPRATPAFTKAGR